MPPEERTESKVFVVIVTYNGMQWLPKCLGSCREYWVILVDNASTDGTVAYMENTYPNILLLKQTENLGFGQANNLGISQALKKGADYVFLLNQDAYLQEGCLETLIKAQKQDPKYGILSPIHLNGKGDRLDQNFSNYVAYIHNADFYSNFVLGKSSQAVYEVPFINAAGWLLTRDILETVGGFDPIFFQYGEDDNYCQRARYHNFKIGVVADAFLNHDREERENTKTQTLEQPARRESVLKSQYGDINKDNLEELKQLLRKRKREFIKTFLKLRFSELPNARQEIHITEKVMQEVNSSREINSLKGNHYLE